VAVSPRGQQDGLTFLDVQSRRLPGRATILRRDHPAATRRPWTRVVVGPRRMSR